MDVGLNANTPSYDISVWNENGSWKNWALGRAPEYLANQAHRLTSLLKGAAPILKTTADSRGWGKNGYSVKEGYSMILSNTREQQNSAKWKNVWSHDSLPKVKFFIWTLVHGKILTGENLVKRGFHDPFNCPLLPKQSRQYPSFILELPLLANCLESSLWRSIQKDKMALNSKSQLGKLGQVLSEILQGKASHEAHLEGGAQVCLLADMASKKQKKNQWVVSPPQTVATMAKLLLS